LKATQEQASTAFHLARTAARLAELLSEGGSAEDFAALSADAARLAGRKDVDPRAVQLADLARGAQALSPGARVSTR
jgi:hypothetical protein